MTEVFKHNVKALTDAADLMIEAFGGNRCPQACFARALRTIISLDCTSKIEYSNNEELIYEVNQMILELIIKYPDLNADWVISRNTCIPELSKEEKDSIQAFIDKVREINSGKVEE